MLRLGNCVYLVMPQGYQPHGAQHPLASCCCWEYAFDKRWARSQWSFRTHWHNQRSRHRRLRGLGAKQDGVLAKIIALIAKRAHRDRGVPILWIANGRWCRSKSCAFALQRVT